MVFKQLAAIVRDWQIRMTPAQVRAGVESLRRQVYIPDLPDAIPLDAVMAAIASGGRAPVLEHKAKPKAVPAPKKRRAPRKYRKAASGADPGLRGGPSKRAQAPVRSVLAHGPRPSSSVMAAADLADIQERTLIAAADALGVRARKGQWWLPG